MAKELPYFRFTAQEWQNGDISLESYDLQGFFINLCAFYWIRDCSVTKDLVEKKFSNAKNLLEQLINKGIIKVNLLENLLEINYLNEQYNLLKGKHEKRSKSGKLGGLAKSSNAKSLLKQNPSYKDKDKDKDKGGGPTKNKFIPPTLLEVTDYCLQRKSIVDPIKFYHGYDSKNWIVGKNKMKDWKKAVVNWEVNKWGLADVKQGETQPPPNFILADHVRIFESTNYENYKKWCKEVGQSIRLDENKKRTDI